MESNQTINKNISQLQASLDCLYNLRDELRVVLRPCWAEQDRLELAIKRTHEHRVTERADRDGRKLPVENRDVAVTRMTFDAAAIELRQPLYEGLTELTEQYGGEREDYRETNRIIAVLERQLNAWLKERKKQGKSAQ